MPDGFLAHFGVIVMATREALTLSDEEATSLKRVVSFYFDEERRHWEESSRPSNHIFNHIRKLRKAVFPTDRRVAPNGG